MCFKNIYLVLYVNEKINIFVCDFRRCCHGAENVIGLKIWNEMLNIIWHEKNTSFSIQKVSGMSELGFRCLKGAGAEDSENEHLFATPAIPKRAAIDRLLGVLHHELQDVHEVMYRVYMKS